MTDLDPQPPAIGPLLGSGRVADVHAYGAHALKLYHPGHGKEQAVHEAAILATLESHGLPVPLVHGVGEYGGRWGLVMDRVDGGTLGSIALADPARAPECLAELVRLQLLLHAVTETRLPPLKARLGNRIAAAPGLDAALKQRLAARLAELPDGQAVCHGDLHPLNVIGEPGETVIIDWLDATAGPPAADACRSYLLLRGGAPQFAAAYLDLYAERSALGREAVLAWLPVMAAARLVEGVPGEAVLLAELAGAV